LLRFFVHKKVDICGDFDLVKSRGELRSEELGLLFPIFFSKYDPQWPAQYEAEKPDIIRAVGRDNIVRISHYSSTSVPGISV